MGRIIKRYSNRKLYDTQEKHYITLENIELLIKREEEVRIVDNDSGEDITAVTLSQIIAERARKNKTYAPAVFVEMIRKGGDTMYDYARKMWQILDPAVNQQGDPRKTSSEWENMINTLAARCDLPTRNDIQRLAGAIDRLEQTVQELEKRMQKQ